MAFPTQNGIYQCKDSINSWSNHLPKLQRFFPSALCWPRSEEKHVGTLPVSLAQGIWAWKCQARSCEKTPVKTPPVWEGEKFPGGTRQVSNEGPGLLGKPYFSLKVQGNSSDLRDILMNNCVQINQKFGAICLVQEVDDKTIPSDTSGLRDTTNKYPPKIVFGRRFDCCSLLSRDPLFHPRIS